MTDDLGYRLTVEICYFGCHGNIQNALYSFKRDYLKRLPSIDTELQVDHHIENEFLKIHPILAYSDWL